MIKVWRAVRTFAGTRSLLTFLLFLLFAAVLWYGHALNVVRERTMRVPIEYIGIPDDVAFASELPTEFCFDIRDQGKRLRMYSSDNLSPIQIDLTRQLAESSGTIHIAAEQVRPKITDQLQGTAKLQQVRPELIVAEYYHQSSKRVPVRLNGELLPAAQYSYTKQPTLSLHSVVVYGKKELLDSITEVFTEPVSSQGVKDTFDQVISLQPIEGVRFAQQQLTLSAIAEQFTEKRFTLAVCPEGVPQGAKMRLFPPTAEVTVQLYLSHFNDVDERTLHLVCQYPSSTTSALPIKVKYSSPYIINARVNPAEAEYIIER